MDEEAVMVVAQLSLVCIGVVGLAKAVDNLANTAGIQLEALFLQLHDPQDCVNLVPALVS
jgi:hypothetical protein